MPLQQTNNTLEGEPAINRTQNAFQWRLLLALFAVGVSLLFVPRPYSTWLLVLLLVIMLLLSIRSTPRQSWQPIKLLGEGFGSVLSPVLRRMGHWVVSHRQELAYPIAVVACLLMAVSAYNLRPENGGLPVDDAARQFLVGGLLLGASLWLSKNSLLLWARPIAPTLEAPVQTRWISLVIGIAILVFVMWVNTLPFKNELDFPINDVLPLDVHQQVLAWLLSLILITRGLLGKTKTKKLPSDMSSANKRIDPLAILRAGANKIVQAVESLKRAPFATKLEVAAVSAIMLVTIALRFYNLELIHRFVDEVHWFDAVPRVWDFSTNIRIFMPFSDVTAFTWIYPYYEWVFVNAMGPSFTAMRLLSAIIGTLGVAATYYLARLLFDRPTALLAALLLATFPPHIQFSRITLNNIADPLFGTLALALLTHGMKTLKRKYFVLAGLALGLTQYFYEGGRLLYPPLVGLFAFYLLLQPMTKREGETRLGVHSRVGRLVSNLALMAILTFIIALPVYTTIAAHRLSLTVRLGEMGYDMQYVSDTFAGTTNAYWDHLLRNVLAYVQLPELGWFYGGRTALMLPFVVPFFLLGLWHAIWRIRQSGMFLLLVWIVAATIGVSLTRDLWSARYVVVFPALMMFVALGIRLTLPLLAPLLGIARNLLRDDDSQPDPRPVYARNYGRILATLMISIVTVLGVLEVNYYFGDHIATYIHQGRFGGDVHDALFRAVNLPDGTYVHIITDQNLFRFDVDTIVRFWNRQDDLQIDIQPRATLTAQYFREQPIGFAHAFFIDTGDEVVFTLLREFFIPEAPRVSPYGVPPEYQMILYFVPPSGRISQ